MPKELRLSSFPNNYKEVEVESKRKCGGIYSACELGDDCTSDHDLNNFSSVQSVVQREEDNKKSGTAFLILVLAALIIYGLFFRNGGFFRRN